MKMMLKHIRKNNFLTLSIGIVYIWFGTLKFFPDLSPAEGLATDTIQELTFGSLPDHVSIVLLALLEVMIGCSFLLNVYRKQIAVVALGHLACTFAPFFFFGEVSFKGNPLLLTLIGQYIIKNLVLIAALFTIIKMDKKENLLIKQQKV
jgi:uncharacterized membrane protein YkgB